MSLKAIDTKGLISTSAVVVRRFQHLDASFSIFHEKKSVFQMSAGAKSSRYKVFFLDFEQSAWQLQMDIQYSIAMLLTL